MSDFVFKFERTQRRTTDQELIEALKAFYDICGRRPFTAREFDTWKDRPACSTVISRRFGSWKKTIARAGLCFKANGQYSADELVDSLERAWRVQGQRPSINQFNRITGISHMPYQRHWGSLAKACRQFIRFQNKEITKEELLQGIPTSNRNGRQSKVRPSLRFAVLARDGYRCQCCGVGADEPGVKLEVDHIVPVAQGGTDEITNLRTLCKECNRGKGAR